MKRFILVYVCILLSPLAGCGGGGTDVVVHDSSATIAFSGIVEDGPIAAAKVSLRDKTGSFYPLYDSSGHTNYEVRTDTVGSFSMRVKAAIPPSRLRVVSVGGVDSATGMDFKKLEMSCPYELFQGVISPVTTLIDALHEQGFSYAEAGTRVRDWLSLPPDVNLLSSPATNLDLQRRALLLSKIALEMDAALPFNLISAETAKPGTALLQEDGTCDPLVLSAFGFNELEMERLSRLQEFLILLNPAVNTPDDAFAIFKREEINHLFDDHFRSMLGLSPPFAENYQINIKVLTEKALSAAGDEVFLLIDPIPSRLFRYIFFNYIESDPTSADPLKQLSPQEKLLLDPVVFATILTSAETDPWIALLARSLAPNSVESPLMWDELPGADNQRRVAYFYSSDLSPHFQAEKLIGSVYDDAINDAVLLKIVEGKAKAGLLEEALAMIATQIIQSEPKANAYRAVANAMIKYNRMEDALSSLDLARDLYRQVVLAKGIASASSTDVDNLMATATAYRKAGDLVNAQSLLDDVSNIATVLSSNTAIIYGNLITGIKNVADAYIAAGDLEAAAPLVEAMYLYSGQTPAFAGTYKLRIYNWSECAKRYAALGNAAMVVQVSNDIESLRNLYATTKTATWVYLPSLIESLYRVGETVKAFALANTLPAGSTYLGSAFKLVATYEALQGHLETAFSIVDNNTYFPKDEDKVDLLTYYAANQENPYIALSLIQAGRFSDARLALAKAEGLLVGPGMVGKNNLTKIRYGYVKLAELYVLIGTPEDLSRASLLLQGAQAAIVDDVYVAAVMVDIALGYDNMGQRSVALTLLKSAQDLIDANPTYYRSDIIAGLSLAEAATLMYEKLIKAYEQVGEKSSVYTAVNLLVPWAQEIHTNGTVNDALASKECDYLLRAALYLDRAGYNAELPDTLDALDAIGSAKASAAQIAVAANRLKKYLSVVATFAETHKYEQGLSFALSLPFTAEREQAIQSLANAYIDRNDFPQSTVASIDSDGDGNPDFFHPLASAAEIAASGLILDDDCDGDGIVDTLDLRPLFKD